MTENSENNSSTTCAHFLAGKKRKCRMLVKAGKRFCGEHAALDPTLTASTAAADGEATKVEARMPCPYDSKHSCNVSQLEKHLAKCNARPKPLPQYIQQGCNVMEKEVEEIRINLTALTDDELLAIIDKVSKIHSEHVGEPSDSFGHHPVLESTLSSLEKSRGSYRHVYQNSSILHNMAESGILSCLPDSGSTAYVEFGSGKGGLSYVLGQAVNLERDSLVMIDRSSPRHKQDNRYKVDGKAHASVHRLRADIADVDLSRVEAIQEARRLVGTGKHLCGAATDLALYCLKQVDQPKPGLVGGVCIALCCHHQCTWQHYVGKSFFKEVDLSQRDFAVMRTLTSWATCGSRDADEHSPPADNSNSEESVPVGNAPPSRYALLGLSAERREKIGRKCKQIIDHGRTVYLSSWSSLKVRLVHYVEPDISLENVLFLASSSPSSSS